MTVVRKLNATAGLAFDYLVLAGVASWALGQPVGRLSVSMLLACLALGWLPAFFYVNRRRIARNDLF